MGRCLVVLCRGYSRQSCGANAVLRVIGERCFLGVRSVCGGVGLYRFRTALVEVAYMFEWKCCAFALDSTQMNSSWRCVPLRRRDLWAKAWQPAPCSPEFSLYCTLEYESLAFSLCFLDQYSERKKSYRTEKGFKCSEFESLPRLRTFPALWTLLLTGCLGELQNCIVFLLDPLGVFGECQVMPTLLHCCAEYRWRKLARAGSHPAGRKPSGGSDDTGICCL